MSDLAINLLASAIAGLAVWLYQRVARRRRSARKKAFLGLTTDRPCFVSIPRHRSSNQPSSVHRRDLAAIVDVAVLIGEFGGQVEVGGSDQEVHGVGLTTEFCVGGPLANERCAAHLARFAPGVRVIGNPERWGPDLLVGTTRLEAVGGEHEYVLVLRIVVDDPKHPLWILCGQMALTNQAAARYLRRNITALRTEFDGVGSFCLGLEVVNSRTYGFEHVERIGDFSAAAFRPVPAG